MNEWRYNERPLGSRFVTDRIGEAARVRVEDEIWGRIVRGDDDAAEFVNHCDDAEERHGLTDDELFAAFELAARARREQQRGWGVVRSNLTEAFDALNRAGVLARENFTCCGTCAATEIDAELDDSRHWHGNLWYHRQDADSLIGSPDGEVHLGFGAYPPVGFDPAAWGALSEAEQEARYQTYVESMMDDIVFPVLRAHGIEPHWNREQSTRVRLTGAHWYAPLKV